MAMRIFDGKFGSNLQEIPTHLFLVLREYVTEGDYISFVNAAKVIRQIKYETVYYRFDVSASKRYYYDNLFRARVVTLVKDISKQLALKYFTYEIPGFQLKIVKDVHHLFLSYGCQVQPQELFTANISHIEMSGIKNISSFEGIGRSFKSMVLSRFTQLTNVSHLCWLHELELHNCQAVTDLSGLSKLRRLKLISCPGIRDVSPLKRISILFIDSCENVSDISQLGTVRDLSLHFCDKIHDISALTRNRRLSIVGCKKIQNYSKLTGIAHLHLSDVPIDGLEDFQAARSLRLDHCDGLRQIASVPPQLNSVELCLCTSLENVQGLRYLKQLSLDHCDRLVDVHLLGAVHSLRLSWCTKLSSLQGLGKGNRSVSVISCSSIVDFSPLRYVRNVTVDSCLGLTRASDLSRVHWLRLVCCEKLVDVSALVNVQRLELIGCPAIQSLVGLSDLPEIVISSCSKLTDLSPLRNNQKIELARDTPSITSSPSSSPSSSSSGHSSSSSARDTTPVACLDRSSDYLRIDLRDRTVFLRKSSSDFHRSISGLKCLLL